MSWRNIILVTLNSIVYLGYFFFSFSFSFFLHFLSSSSFLSLFISVASSRCQSGAGQQRPPVGGAPDTHIPGTPARTCTYIHSYMHANTSHANGTSIHTYIHSYIHTYMDTHTCVHTHMRTHDDHDTLAFEGRGFVVVRGLLQHKSEIHFHIIT